MLTLSEIRDLAVMVRRWADLSAEQYDCYDETLCGMCAIASAELFRLLVRRGVPAKLQIVHNNGLGHVCVIVNDYFIDVTATQFDDSFDEVMMVEVNKENLPWWWGGTNSRKQKVQRRRFTNVADLRNFMKQEGWPRTQMPLDKRKVA